MQTLGHSFQADHWMPSSFFEQNRPIFQAMTHQHGCLSFMRLLIIALKDNCHLQILHRHKSITYFLAVCMCPFLLQWVQHKSDLKILCSRCEWMISRHSWQSTSSCSIFMLAWKRPPRSQSIRIVGSNKVLPYYMLWHKKKFTVTSYQILNI